MNNTVEVSPGIFISIPRLMGFVYEAKIHTYATGEGIVPPERIWIPGNKEHEYSSFSDPDYDLYYRDSYSGYLAAPGREYVKLGDENGLTVWSMSYDGGMKPPFDVLNPENVAFAHECFGLLKMALCQPPKEMPLRGPDIFHNEKYSDWIYHFHFWTGDFRGFAASEAIIRDGLDEVFKQNIAGGLVIHK